MVQSQVECWISDSCVRIDTGHFIVFLKFFFLHFFISIGNYEMLSCIAACRISLRETGQYKRLSPYFLLFFSRFPLDPLEVFVLFSSNSFALTLLSSYPLSCCITCRLRKNCLSIGLSIEFFARAILIY